MQGSPTKILEVIEKNRSRAAIGFLLVFLGSATLLYFVVSGKTRLTDPVEQASAITLPEPSDLRARRLDGVLVPTGEESRAPFGVMIENHPDARPLSGISKAQVVIEAHVEGSFTRFLAFFDPSTEAEEIGPVRSARPYYVEWANSWRAIYAHVGGSPEALQLVRTKEHVFDLDQFRYGNTFWRSIQRFAPHNVYTNMEKLNAFATEREIADGEMPAGWQFEMKPDLVEPGDKTEIHIPYGGIFNVTWKYDAESDLYTRYQNGSVQKDKDGSVVTAKNIIVVETEATVLDSEGRLRLRTTGTGEAKAFRNGHAFDIAWERKGDEIFQLKTVDGTYALEPGTTWVEVVTGENVEVSGN
jgi:hypothetical protein